MLDSATKRKIDSARQILVGKVPDPKAQVEQITTALVYKFMDDMDKEAEELGGEARFFANGFSQYSWTKLMDNRLSGQERLELYAEAIANMSKNPHIPQLFRNIFKGAFLPFRDPRTLSLFLKEINEFKYDHSENLGNAFEYLLSILGSQGDAGQFRTPRHIIDFIVEVVNPQKNETILDPACGTAGFLISAYKHILKTNSSNFKPEEEKAEDKIVQGETATETIIEEKTHYSGDLLSPDDKTKLTQNIAGYDISPDMVKLALVNLYLHGFSDPKIFEYDTLSSDKRWGENFDVILANPPFMTPKGGISPHKKFTVNSSRAEVLFVDYILEHLNISGRAAIIVPDGVISNTNASSYITLRKRLIEDNLLWAVVSMPSGVFRPYAAAKTSILFVDRELAKHKNEILFINLENDGFDLGEQRKKIDKNDVPQIIEVLNKYKQNKSINYKNAHAVEKTEIKNTKSFLLSGNYYLHNSQNRDSEYSYVPLHKILEESTLKVKDSEIPTSKIEPLSITMKEGLVKQTDKFNKRIANKDISGYKLVKKGQLVIGFPIDEGVLDILEIAEYGAVSPAYSVWDVNLDDEFDIQFFNMVIKSPNAIEVYKKLMNRTANRRRSIKKEVFLGIQIPKPPLEVQKEAINPIAEANQLKQQAELKAEESKNMVNNTWV